MLRWDLNIVARPGYKNNGVCDVARRLGYSGIGLNHVLEAKDLAKKVPDPAASISSVSLNEKKRGLSISDPEMDVKPLELEIVSRITVNVYSIQDVANYESKMKKDRKGYNIVAARPMTESSLKRCCESKVIDLISLDLTERSIPKLKLTYVKVAQGLGISFEICYAPAIRDSTIRRNTIANSQALVRLLRGRDLILSSGAENSFELRGPADIMNFGKLFGLEVRNMLKIWWRKYVPYD